MYYNKYGLYDKQEHILPRNYSQIRIGGGVSHLTDPLATLMRPL